MKRILVRYLLLVTATVLAPLTVCSGPRETISVKPDFDSGRIRTMVVFGDSIVAGYDVTEGWPQILGRDLAGRYAGLRVVNAGRSGDTSGDGLARLERDVLGHHPDLVLVAFGFNDMKKRFPPAEFKENLGTMVNRLRQEQALVALLTTTRLARGAEYLTALDAYNEVIKNVAEEKQVLLINVYAESSGLNAPEYLLDVVHPNQQGHQRLAQIIGQALLR